MMQKRTRKLTLALGFSLALVGMLGGTMSQAAAEDLSSGEAAITGDTDQLTPTEQNLLVSDALKRISVNPTTGDITAVEPMTPEELAQEMGTAPSAPGAVQPFVAYPGLCEPTTVRPCWHGAAGAQPIGFSNGITDGTWTSRRNFWTASYYAKLCWMDLSIPKAPRLVCMPERNGTNAWIQFGAVVTGKKVDVHYTR
jgi:hypothetical protein